LGRAGLFALALSPQHEVEIVGPAKSGNIWFPMQNMGISIRPYPWNAILSLLQQSEK